MMMGRLIFRISDSEEESLRNAAKECGGVSALLRRLIADQLSALVSNPVSTSPSEDALVAKPATTSGEADALQSERVTARLRATEMAALEQEAHRQGLRPSTWAAQCIRSSLSGRPAFSRPETAALREIASQIGRVGANLNQITRALHVQVQQGGGGHDLTREVADLAAEVMTFRAEVRDALKRKLTYWTGA